MENVSKMTNLSVEFFHIGDIGYLLHGKIFQNSYNGGPNHVFFPKWRKMTIDSYSENDMENFSEIQNRDELGSGGVTHRKRDEIIYILRVSGGIF